MDRPTIGLAMMVRNVEKTVARTIESVLPWISEVSICDTGSTDETIETVREVCEKASCPIRVSHFSEKTNPEAYRKDAAETFKPFDVPGPFTGKSFLADWSTPRNMSFDACRSDYILMLDGDDMAHEAQELPGIVETMQEKSIDLLALDYHYMHDEHGQLISRSLRDRILRKASGLRWYGATHEAIAGESSTFATPFHVVDTREAHDPTGINRVHLRGMKVLLRDFIEKGKLDPRLTWHLGMEAHHSGRAALADMGKMFLEEAAQADDFPERVAWARYWLGEIAEKAGNIDQAATEFFRANQVCQHMPEPVLGMCRVALARKQWELALRYIEAAVAMRDNFAIIHCNPIEREVLPMLYLGQLCEATGRKDEARQAYEKARTWLPGDQEIETALGRLAA
jgi:tetratricopeptide (TPR) repeat protein